MVVAIMSVAVIVIVVMMIVTAPARVIGCIECIALAAY